MSEAGRSDEEQYPNLGERLLERGSPEDPDTLLDIFLGWVADRGLEPYPAQEEALLEIFSGEHVILKTPTGSGKSLVASAMLFDALARGRRAWYTAPVKALVSEKFFDMCGEFSPENVGMMTGDSTVNRDAPIVCCTAEVLANIVLREGEGAPADDVCMDEFHFYGDRDRGVAWQIPLLVLRRARFLLMSATLGDTSDVERRLAAFSGRDVAVVASEERPVPLDFFYRETPLHETVDDLVRGGMAPIYQVNFTQRECAEQAQSLMSTDFSSKEEKRQLARALRGSRFDTPYGKDVQRYLRHGIGLHHGGLLPKYRLLVERLSRRGLLKVICGTDTLGVGVNVPIRTVLFTRLCKYDGEKVRILSVRDFKQIAGRAGRKGFDDRGQVVCQAPEHVIENKRLAMKAAGEVGKKKKYVKKQPPTKGYVPWDEKTFRGLESKPPETLESHFDIDHGMLLNVMQRPDADYQPGGGYRALLGLIDRAHETDGAKKHLRRRARQVFRSLREAGILEVEPHGRRRGQVVAVSGELQEDFSIFHTLSLWLLDTLGQLDPAAPDYALDVITLVESILESPKAILLRQVHKIKGEMVAEMKAAGIEYEERMERLEKVTWPKPRADFIYESFDRFAERHPWVAQENIRPKAIIREMFERFASFDDYVRDLGLERIEGLLLRYLTIGYKTLVQTLPDSFKTDEVYDAIGYLRATLARVDSSLVQAWERMVYGEEDAAAPEPVRKLDISRDSRTFNARVRSELHRLVEALSRRDWEEAAASVRPDGRDPWPPERFDAAMAPFFEEYERLVFDHRARLADRTTIREEDRHVWRLYQILCDPEGDDLWAIEGLVDLRDDTAPDGPLVSLVRVGT